MAAEFEDAPALGEQKCGKDLSGSLQGAGGIGGLLARTDMNSLWTQPANAHAFYHADGNGNITVTFCIPNVAGTHSFFYHIVPDRSGTTGPGRNIKQTICWTEPIDKSKCPCPK
jgi:hypothetical protein